jgi:predicted PurR-regulated permease PerM
MFRPSRAERFVRVYEQSARAVTGYMFGNVLTSFIAGIIVFITLSALGVPFPLLLGLWVALVDLLPLVGGLIAGVPTVAIAFLHSPVAGVVTLAVFIVYQQVENHVLNPVVMSRTVRLNPLWVLLAVLAGAKLGSVVGGALGAFVGALIGIPVGGAVQVVVREIRRGPSPPADGAPASADPLAAASPGPATGPGPEVP